VGRFHESVDQGLGGAGGVDVDSRACVADGFKDCTKLEKAKWKPASEAEAKAKELGYEVRRSKVEGLLLRGLWRQGRQAV
jgi:hypothetical protein